MTAGKSFPYAFGLVTCPALEGDASPLSKGRRRGRRRRGGDDGFEVGGVLGQIRNSDIGTTDGSRYLIATARCGPACRDAKQVAPPAPEGGAFVGPVAGLMVSHGDLISSSAVVQPGGTLVRILCFRSHHPCGNALSSPVWLKIATKPNQIPLFLRILNVQQLLPYCYLLSRLTSETWCYHFRRQGALFR